MLAALPQCSGRIWDTNPSARLPIRESDREAVFRSRASKRSAVAHSGKCSATHRLVSRTSFLRLKDGLGRLRSLRMPLYNKNKKISCFYS